MFGRQVLYHNNFYMYQLEITFGNELQTLSKQTKSNRAGGMGQVVQTLPSKLKTLSSTPALKKYVFPNWVKVALE
jgi:hypothetical protein